MALQLSVTFLESKYKSLLYKSAIYTNHNLAIQIEILFFFNLLAVLCSMWDLSSPTRDRTCAPCIGSAES